MIPLINCSRAFRTLLPARSLRGCLPPHPRGVGGPTPGISIGSWILRVNAADGGADGATRYRMAYAISSRGAIRGGGLRGSGMGQLKFVENTRYP